MAKSERDKKIQEFVVQGKVLQKSIEAIDSYSSLEFTPEERAIGEKTVRQLSAAFPEVLKKPKPN